MRHGIGVAITVPDDTFLEPAEETLAETLGDDIGSALLGKWHLGADDRQGGADAPRQTGGYDRYAGNLKGAVYNYSRWRKTTDGSTTFSTAYATFDATNEAIDWITNQSEPWVAVVSYNAAHTPFHVPPGYEDELSGVSCSDPASYILCYRAMLSSLDDDIGVLLDTLDVTGQLTDTTVIIVGDNGSPTQVVEAPYVFGKAKGTVYQGGVHVPLIVWGASVIEGGRAVDSPVQTLDLFATILELTGREDVLAALETQTTIDSVSLVPYLENASQAALRRTIYTEGFGEGDPANGDAAITNGRYKLVRAYSEGAVAEEECYDLAAATPGTDPEADDLFDRQMSLAEHRACRRLGRQMDALRASAGL
jgi:arylsulfatase A-like enzyme